MGGAEGCERVGWVDVDGYGVGRTGEWWISTGGDLGNIEKWFDAVRRWVGLGRVGGGGLESGMVSVGATSNSGGCCKGIWCEDDEEPLRVLLLPELPASVEGDPSLRARLLGLELLEEERPGDGSRASSPPVSKS